MAASGARSRYDRADLARLLALATRAACAGGLEVAGHFRALDALLVRDKSAGDYVTDADLASEAEIRTVLCDETPGFAVLGEEGGGPRSWEAWAEPTWLVDPLDGTTNFLRGLPMVGVSVALVVHGSPVVGVVHAPMLGLTFSAATGMGAHLDGSVAVDGVDRNGVDRGRAGVDCGGAGAAGAPGGSHGRLLAVSDRPVAQALCGHGFLPRARRVRDERHPGMVDSVLAEVEDLRRIGSASLDLAWTAAGALDGFFHLSLGPWDVAAGALLVREAGGVVTDYSGDDRAWLASGDILAGTPACHDLLLASAAPATASASVSASVSASASASAAHATLDAPATLHR